LLIFTRKSAEQIHHNLLKKIGSGEVKLYFKYAYN
jgi:hypothetical protein